MGPAWEALRWAVCMVAATSGPALPMLACRAPSNRQGPLDTSCRHACPALRRCIWFVCAYDRKVQAGTGKSNVAFVQIPYARQGPDGWTEYRAQDGQFYYFNHHTKENTWDKPACWP